MACEKYDKLLQSFFDQSLNKSEQKELKSHLDGCSSCRTDFIFFKKVFEGLDELQDEELSFDVASGIKDLIEEEPAHRPVSSIHRIVQPVSSRFTYKWALAAAAVFIFMITVFTGTDNKPALPAPALVASIDITAPKLRPLEVGNVTNSVSDRVKLLVDGEEVSLLRKGSSAWETVSEETELATGDRIKTNSSTRALLFYRDSGRLKVLPDTELQILTAGIRIKTGTTWIKIFKEGTNFSASTPNAVASVRGTVYTVEYSPEELSTRVNLFSSHKPEAGVEVTSDLGSRMLPQGTFVDVTIDEITQPSAIPLETYLAFNQLPPDEVVTNHHIAPATIEGTVEDTVAGNSSSLIINTDDLPDSSSEVTSDREENFFDGIRQR